MKLPGLASGQESGRPQAPPPTFGSEVRLVTIDALVLDGKDHPVSGLTREDFTIEEDGQPREVASFEAFDEGVSPAAPVSRGALAAVPHAQQEPGRAFAILLDDTFIPFLSTREAQNAVSSFLTRSTSEGDRVVIGNTTGDLWWSARLPEGREDLLAVVKRFRGRAEDDGETTMSGSRESQGDRSHGPGLQRMTEYQAFLIVEGRVKGDNALAESIDARRRERMRRTVATLRRELDALSGTRARKAVLLLTQGFIQDSSPALADAEAAARDANAAIYFFDVRGLFTAFEYSAASASAPDPSRLIGIDIERTMLDSAGAQDLADATGGFSVRNTNDLGAGTQRVAAESRVFYLLGFEPPPGKPPDAWRKLRVSVRPKGLSVRARRGYTVHASPSGGAEAATGRGDHGSPALAQARDWAYDADAIPLRVQAYALEPRRKDRVRVLVAAEFEASSGPERLEFSVTATHRDSGRTFESSGRLEVKSSEAGSSRWRSLVREFELPSGVVQARVVVHDPERNLFGAASQRFEIPPLAALRVSTPVITNRVDRDPGAADHARGLLVAHRTFSPAGHLYCDFEVFGAAGAAASRVVSGVEVKTADGRTVLKTPVTRMAPGRDGRLIRLVGMNLDDMPEGLYDLVLEVRDEVSGRDIERHEAFTLARESEAP